MEPIVSETNDVWVTAQFVSGKTSSLQATPMSITLHSNVKQEDGCLPSFENNENTCIAICKKACLQPSVRIDNPFTAGREQNCTDIFRCTSSTTAIVEYQLATGAFLEESLLNYSQTTSHFSKPQDYVLYACEEFLEAFGFYDKEIVFISAIKPLPLDKVTVVPLTGISCEEDTIEKLVQHIYDQCTSKTIIANTGFKLLHQLHPFRDIVLEPPAQDDDHWILNQENGCSPNELPPPLAFEVLETSPVLQGRITRDTKIIILPTATAPAFQTSPIEPEEYCTSDNSSVSIDDSLFGRSQTPPTSQLHTFLSRGRTISASDIKFEDSMHVDDMTPFVNDHPVKSHNVSVRSKSMTEQFTFVIEARLGEEFALLHHYVVLPKQLAREHNIWELQNILISVSSVETNTGLNPLGGTVLALNNELSHVNGTEKEQEIMFSGNDKPIHKRLAIARVYDTAEELQALVPRVLLNNRYSDEDLSVAYLHPELMFILFPETLSVESRKFFIAVENIMVTPSPSPSDFTRDNPPLLSAATGRHVLPTKGKKTEVKKMLLGSVTTPSIVFPEELIKESIKKHLIDSQNKIVINRDDVFSLNTEHGRLMIRILETNPHYDHGGISGEEFLYQGQFSSYLPYLYYSAFPVSYWDVPLPPGLEDYSNTLFQYLLPNMMSKNKSTSFSCTAVMVSGPPGVGKSTVIRSVAKRCRLNVKEFNCYDFFSEGMKAAEQKLRIAFEKAIDCMPCIVILKEIHVLTKQDLSVASSNNEPRLDAAFEQHISNINEQLLTAKYPFIVVGVTSYPKDVSPRIQHCFLHDMNIAPPSQEQRTKMIKGFTNFYSISKDINIVDLARRSAGFLLGDYIELFSKAHKFAYTDVLSLIKKYLDSSDGWIRGHFMSIFGILINQDHIDLALNRLHSSHSGYIGAPKIPNVKWKDVGGLEEAKKEILETIQLPLLYPELFVGDLRRSGILLYGAPGTGKTLLAKAVATECSLNFLSVKGPELINMYVGQTEENIREIFTRARGAAPCVVFFDELDSLAPNRGKSGDSGGVMDRVVSQLLAELDGLDQKKNVFVIGATNRPDLIDPALLRPGRFDRLVYLDVCDDVQSKLTILKAITRKFQLHKNVNLMAIAETCPPHVTGADLYALCADSMLSSLRRQINTLEEKCLSDVEWSGSLVVDQNDLLSSLKNLKPSVSVEELEMYRKKQFLQNIN